MGLHPGHTAGMSEPLPAAGAAAVAGQAALTERMERLLSGALAVWGAAGERRRLRLFGFRPAVEAGVLKREWRDMQVRVHPERLLLAKAGGPTLSYAAGDRVVKLDGEPFAATAAGVRMAEALVSLVESYERWVEAREGRPERLRRARAVSTDPRPVNALAETRRIRRILTQARGR